ncbi:MAG: MarR family transcriptional regulator [Verrucomicrobia bacterium]|nr:MAG: MarR family transcriptional regulator [Verrucomicrobiota bacterium]
MPRKSQTRKPIDSPDRRRLPPLLRRAWYGLNQAFRRRIAHLEITPDQFTVMRTLTEHDGITQRELTHLISSDPNTVVALLNRMEQAGLIERETHERDRRANRLRLKARGNAKYEKARSLALGLQAEVLAAVPETRREQFLRDLDHLAAACRAATRSTAAEE